MPDGAMATPPRQLADVPHNVLSFAFGFLAQVVDKDGDKEYSSHTRCFEADILLGFPGLLSHI